MPTKKVSYRPTVRYDLKFKQYVDQLCETTGLNQNQILKLALYVLNESDEGIMILEAFANEGKESEVMLPQPVWNIIDDWYLWLGSDEQEREREEMVMKIKKRIGEETRKHKRREGEPTTKKKRREDEAPRKALRVPDREEVESDARKKITYIPREGGINPTTT